MIDHCPQVGPAASTEPRRRGDAGPMDPQPPTSSATATADPAGARAARAILLEAVDELAARQGGVCSRRQLADIGVSRGQIRAQVRARRWQRLWSDSVVVHSGPVGVDGRRWAAVFAGGDRAMLDGASALLAGGMTGWDEESLRVSVPRGVARRTAPGLDVRPTRRWSAGHRAASGVPRARPEVATVHAALWARTDRQASLLLTMPVQQGLTTAERVGTTLLTVRRDRRRRLLHDLVVDLLGGAHSLGELDVARECRARGLPEPSRQVVRRGPDGRSYLDIVWEEWGVVVEVDGIQHGWVQRAVGDALRHNDVALEGAVVLRLPVLGLRVAPDPFFDQIRRALIGAGCPLPPPTS